MFRSNLGISFLPVSEESDPGFGPDTEQRRVEFAAKLEEEAFSIAVLDAEKIAKKNLITALRIWKVESLIPKVSKLNLRSIMFIWTLFEISFIDKSNIENIFDDLIKKNNFKIFIKNVEFILANILEKKNESIKIDIKQIEKIRQNYGGDLIFSLNNKNFKEIKQIFEMTYSKLPNSLRISFQTIVCGIEIPLKLICQLLLKKDNFIIEINKYFINSYNNEERRIKHLEIQFNEIIPFIKIFDEKFANKLNFDNPQNKEVESKVKSYYGID